MKESSESMVDGLIKQKEKMRIEMVSQKEEMIENESKIQKMESELSNLKNEKSNLIEQVQYYEKTLAKSNTEKKELTENNNKEKEKYILSNEKLQTDYNNLEHKYNEMERNMKAVIFLLKIKEYLNNLENETKRIKDEYFMLQVHLENNYKSQIQNQEILMNKQKEQIKQQISQINEVNIK